MKKFYIIIDLIFLLQMCAFAQLGFNDDGRYENISGTELVNPSTVSNLSAFYRDGQVFVTWDNITTTGVKYNLYKSPDPIQYGSQLTSAQNLGAVRDNSANNMRLTNLLGGTRCFKTDSAETPLSITQGLFVATCKEQGSFYYAVTTIIGGVEDTTILFGSNSLSVPILEDVAMPQPVWQETQNIQGRILEIYAQFVSKVTSTNYPQMTNEGSFAFHFAINKQGSITPHPITFYMRPSGNSFLEYLWGIGEPNEWIVTIDDWFPNGQELAASYYGYHENYDIFTYNNPIPTSGTIFNYSAARVAYTVNWCLQNLAVDTTRTYMTGWSMGGIGVILNSIMIPEKIAAIYIRAPIFNMSISTVATYANQLWGTASTNLQTNEGYTRNQRLNSCYMVSEKINTSLPIMYTFCGKNDVNVGWTEKIAFYDSVNNSNHGGFHFWSQTNHFNTLTQWMPSFPNFSFFTRYRTNLSYPAFSNCSLNDNPGNGNSTNGDSIGTINGYLDWSDDITDSTSKWEITMFVKNLLTSQGTLVAPDSGLTDITLRRLQKYSVPVGHTVFWENFRNGVLVQQGSFIYTGSLITIPEVKVYKDSSRLKVFYVPTVVPVELLSFSSSVVDNDVTLNWTTATETNNSGYSIERKNKNEKDWNSITFAQGKGTTTEATDYSYLDKNLKAGIYNYRLKQIDFDGTFEYSNVIEVDVRSLSEYALEQNFPNPFNPTTTIGYVLREKSNAKLILLNAIGEEVAVLVNEEQDKGFHKVDFNGSTLASGVYFYRLQAGDPSSGSGHSFVQTRKMILLK